jgi:hypothetical protein
VETTIIPHQAERKYILGVDDEELRQGIIDGTIPSTIVDSGATSGVGTEDDPSHRTGEPSNKRFTLPSGAVIQATEIAEYPFDVRAPAKELHITPGVSQHSLLSTGKYADANYITVFDKDTVNIYDANDTIITVTKDAILRGWRDTGIKLWRIPLVKVVRNVNTDTIIVNKPPTEFLPDRPPTEEAIHNVYELKTSPELVRYLHAAAGFPTKPQWITAIKNKQYASWPGLSVDAVRRHFPESDETHKGHGRKTPSGLRSTKPKENESIDSDDDFQFNVPENAPLRPIKKEKSIFIKVLDMEDEATQKIWTDQPGRFPKKSMKGSQYMMVLTESDSDAILVEPMKNRTSGEMIRAYQTLINRLRSAGIAPKQHILDNECSSDFKETIKANNMTYQLVPPHDHRRNKAEKAIQTFKDHFVAILCGADTSFPLNLWDLLLRQAEHTLNMLRPARMTPTVSAYTYLWGQHDYNTNPFAPLGCKVESHLVPSIRETWAPHTASGYYVGTSWEHYRCHEVYIIDTRHTRICSSVFFKHKYLTMPSLTPADALIQAADNLTTALAGVIPPPSMTTEAIAQLISIFKTQAEKEKDDATVQRVLRERAQAERALTEAIEPTTKPANEPTTPQQETRTYPPLEIEEHPQVDAVTPDDNYNSARPADNTRYQRKVRTITQDYLFHLMDTPFLPQQLFTAKQASSRKYPLQFLCDFAYSVLDDETGDLLEYRHLLKHPKYKDVWSQSFGKEIRRLATVTETIAFVSKQQIPRDRRRDITYGRIVCAYRSEKKDPYRTRITMGGNLINYPGDCGTPTADLLTVKLMFNSIISTPNAKFMTIDIKDFYLMTPMDRFEYFRMKLELFPQDIIDEYGLRDKVDTDGNVFCEVRRGMYGLPQAGIIAQDLLTKRLHQAGYRQSKVTPGYWRHEWRPISFTLVVDDFGVKYINKTDVEHLTSVLNQDYEIDLDWDGTRYLGLTLDWDYKLRKVHLSMPGYIEKACIRFGHTMPDKPQRQPHPHTLPTYGATIQYAKHADQSPPATKEQQKYIQQVIGVLLYYGRAVDSTLLVALSSLASAQAAPTEHTLELIKWLLDYAATNPDAILTYESSDMILAVHSDASYLSEANARSRVGGHFFCSSDVSAPPNNGAVLNISKILKAVMSSAAEAELGALYINASEAVPMRQLLAEMGHKQPKTPIQTDNTTACGVVNNNIQPRRTKAMDMRFHWLRCRDSQGQFRYYWGPGIDNRADYYTKHHCAAHHIEKRPEILTSKFILNALRASIQRTPATSGKGLVKNNMAATAA